MKGIMILFILAGLTGCDRAQWVDIPYPSGCNDFNKVDDFSIKPLAVAACQQQQKRYTGERQCVDDTAQVKCE